MKKRLIALMMALCLVLLCACGSTKTEKSSDLSAVKADILAQMGADNMIELTGDDLLEMFGIQADDVKQYIALISKESLSSDEVLIFEAVDDDAAKRILEKVNSRYQNKLVENKDYLPDEYTKISNCEVEQNGRYISMIISSDAESLTKLYTDSFK